MHTLYKLRMVQMVRQASFWLVCLLLMVGLVCQVGCESRTPVCPPLPLPGDVFAGEIDNFRCCSALAICCKEVPKEADLADGGSDGGDGQETCNETATAGALVSCQALYYSMLSYEYCKPVLVEDHPNLAPEPKEATTGSDQ